MNLQISQQRGITPMSDKDIIQIACPHCAWHGFRDKGILERDRLITCAECSALVSADAAIAAVNLPEVREISDHPVASLWSSR
jgi:hypothetical protein